MEHQVYSGMSHSEHCMDPMCAEVATVVDSWIEVHGHKKAKLTKGGQVSAPPIQSPYAMPCTPSTIVHVIDDHMQDMATAAKGGGPFKGWKQYMSRNRSLVAGAHTVVNSGQQVKTDVAVLSKSRSSTKV